MLESISVAAGAMGPVGVMEPVSVVEPVGAVGLMGVAGSVLFTVCMSMCDKCVLCVCMCVMCEYLNV